MNIELVSKGLDVLPLQIALQDETLWNQNTARTGDVASPHYKCDDIWPRYAEDFRNPGPFESVWYDVSDKMPIKPLVDSVYGLVGATELGGVLITRIQPGCSVKPHKDFGWHAEYYEKFGVSVKANDKQAFCFEDTSLVTEPGDLFTFYNQNTHWVTNDSDEDRISVIICVRRD